MYLHREGYGILAKYGFIFLFTYGGIYGLTVNTPIISQTVGILLLIIYLWMISFFRVPKRVMTMDPNLIIAPADGKIVVIEKTFVQEHLEEDRIQLSIFMSPFNVHINRSPIKGEVSYHKYHKGDYLVAYHPKSSELNERNSYAFKNDKVEVLIRQIAGKLARRICYYVPQGSKVDQNEEVGFIRFGSRVDVFIPLDAEILIEKDQQVKGGVTPLAKLA